MLGRKKAEPKTPHFLSLHQNIVAGSQEQKCELKYVIHTSDKFTLLLRLCKNTFNFPIATPLSVSLEQLQPEVYFNGSIVVFHALVP
jgi:hypothetical protein